MNNDAKRIVDIVITRESAGVEGANFGTPLFISKTKAVGAFELGTFSSSKDVGTLYTTTSAEYYASVAHFRQTGAPKSFKILRPATADSMTVALNKVIDVDNQFYGVLVEDLSSATVIGEVATWCEGNGKFLFTGDSETLHASVILATDTLSIPAVLNAGSYKKTHCLYNKNLRVALAKEAGYADVALCSYILGKKIGSYTFVNKTLIGMTPDVVSTTVIGYLKTKNTSWYNKMYGVDITEGGRTCGGVLSDWADVEIGIDWLGTTMQESVLNTVFSAQKIAYTDDGIATLKGAVQVVLAQGVTYGLLAGFTIDAQSASSQTTADKNNRVYNGLSWTATLAGAIHSVTINGKVSV